LRFEAGGGADVDGVRVAVVVALGGQAPDPEGVALVGRVGQEAGGGARGGLVAADFAQRDAAVVGRGGDVVRHIEVVGGPLVFETGHLAGEVGEPVCGTLLFIKIDRV
jgi:hypothetical protein